MKLIPPSLLQFLGWNTQGDLGPWTFYTSKRNALVWYLRAPPTKPPSPLQAAARAAFAAAALAWAAQTDQTRADWERASLAAHLRITGLNLWMYWQLTADDAAIRTIEHQTGISLLP